MKILKLFALGQMWLLASLAVGQVSNGYFNQGGADWDWHRADIPAFPTWMDCIAELEQEPWNWNSHVFSGTQGNIAVLHGGADYHYDTRKTCGAASQSVYVPTGAELKFKYLIGTIVYDNTTSIQEGVFRAQINDGGSTDTILSGTGYSKRANCSTFNSCPEWRYRTVDVSDYWGRTVDLRFTGFSTYWRNSLAPYNLIRTFSPVYVGDVRFEQIPPSTNSSPIGGTWYNPNRDGHGLNISRTPSGDLQVMWFTYLPSGTPVWFMSDTVSMSNGSWSANMNKASRDPVTGSIFLQAVGNISFTMYSNDELMFEWSLNSQSGVQSTGAERMYHLFGGGNLSGLWYEPAYSGWGITLDVEGVGPATQSFATVFFHTPSGHPTWAQGMSSGNLTGQVDFNLNVFTGNNLCPGCTGTSSYVSSQAGDMYTDQLGLWSKTHVDIQTAAGLSFQRGTSSVPVSIGRLTYP